MASDDITEQYAEAMNEAISSATKAEEERDDALAAIGHLKELVLTPTSDIDWQGLYKIDAEFQQALDDGWDFDEIEDCVPFDSGLSPRNAFRLHDAATRLTVAPQTRVPVFDDAKMYCSGDLRSALPPIAQKMADASKPWAAKFQQCYPRIANRLAKGAWEKPSCTAEEMAFLNILAVAQRVPPKDMLCNGPTDDAPTAFDQLPSYPRVDEDLDSGFLAEFAMHDTDVLMLFGDSTACIAKSDDPGDLMGICNLRPEEWFDEFGAAAS